MQIPVAVGQKPDWHRGAHPYIGVSKKPCFLCSQILHGYSAVTKKGTRQPYFKARESHWKVYPLWTLPRCENAPFATMLFLAAAIFHANCQVQQKLQEGPILRPSIAESSAGVTHAGSLSTDLVAAKDHGLKFGRAQNDNKLADAVERPKLGRVIKTVQVVLLPEDGSEPKVVPITFHALPEVMDLRIPESGLDLVPDCYQF